MKRCIHVVILLSLVLVQGCKRTDPDEAPQESAGAPGEVTGEAGAEMVLLEAGRFTMGDEKEIDATPHEVSISSFYIDMYPVTQEQYDKVMGGNPSRWKGDKNPVEQVRWSDAVKFCNARSLKEGLQPCYDLQSWECNFEANGYRLPTEAEWEYACRAGSKTQYFFGNDSSKVSDFAWVDSNAGGKPHPVGQKKPNPWGLYDMCGNVWEWCNDFYQVDYYQMSPADDPRGPKEGETKVVRGGAWKFSADSSRSGYRYNEDPGYSDVCFGYDIYGFRCVKNTNGS